MEEAILIRYAERRVPRYTSYPTAPNFSPAVDEGVWRDWLARLEPGSGISIYVHVPFCRAMCWYCGCHTTVTARSAPVERYLERLTQEIELAAAALPRPLEVRSLHFGGGSPTLMSPTGLDRVMRVLRAGFDFAADAELAIEVDPRTLQGPLAAALAREGLGRASIGVQSFDPQVQRAINRIQTFEETADAVAMLRRHAVRSINFDLVYGLPHQTIRSCRETATRALALRPDRFAVFGYAHVPDFKRHQRKIDTAALPDAAERLGQAEAIAEALEAAGYRRIGLDHFALPDDPLARAAEEGRLHRNFQGYTTDDCATLLGFGASAISRTPCGYAQNMVRIGDYQHSIEKGRLPITRGCAMQADDILRATVIERLMCDYRVDLSALAAERLLDEVELGPLTRDGLIEMRGTAIEVRPEARSLVRAIAAVFDAYLERGAGRHVGAA